MILTVTPNPCVDKTLFIDALRPGEKIRAPRCTSIAGGKGCNVSRAVKAMGRDTIAMPMVGGATGAHVVELLEQQDGIRCAPVWVGAMTRTITTVLEEPIHRQTALFEPGPQVTEAECAAFMERFEAVAPTASLVTFNGSAPDPKLDSLYRDLVACAQKHGVRSIVDAYGTIFARALEARPYMVKPNIEEAEQWLGRPLRDREAQWTAVDALLEQGVALVVLSLGAEGALVADGRQRFHMRPPAIEEVNPVGSGDALVAGFAIGLVEGMELMETARLGVAMGAANALSWDIGRFTAEQVHDLMPKCSGDRMPNLRSGQSGASYGK